MNQDQRLIDAEVTVPAGIDEVWAAWTTEAGIRSFFAPACRIELRVDGPYEILFQPDAPEGSRGAEGTRILSFQSPRMLSFTWNAPPHLAEVRRQLTHVWIRLTPDGRNRTRCRLTHGGWGEGGQWDEALQYFTRAWTAIVLPNLAKRFAEGPRDWTRDQVRSPRPGTRESANG